MPNAVLRFYNIKERDAERDLPLVSSLLIHVSECVKGKEIEAQDAWLADSETFALKTLSHSLSVYYLRAGTKVEISKNLKVGFIDIASISVLARATMEAYLAFYYIYVDPTVSDAERRFRYDIWKLGAYADRQSYLLTDEDIAEKQSGEKERFEEARDKVINNPLFAGLTTDKQKKAKKGDWRLGNEWASLATVAEFNEKHFRDLYKHLSAYAHSGGASLFQLRHGNREGLNDTAAAPLNLCLFMICKTIQDYALLHDDRSFDYEGRNQELAAYNYWLHAFSEVNKEWGHASSKK
jgi:hypothetical protein